MMLRTNFYRKLKKGSKSNQSYLYILNKILSIVKEKNIKVIGITSSFMGKNEKDTVCLNICTRLKEKNIKVCLINACLDDSQKESSSSEGAESDGLKVINTKNIDPLCLEKLVGEEKNGNLVVMNLPPVNIFADSLEYAKISEAVFLVEKYGYSRYSDFENTIEILKQNKIEISGIITHI